MTTYTWLSGLSANWAVAADWTPGGGPPQTAADTALINAAGIYTVTIGTTKNYTIGGLILNAAGGELYISKASTLNIAGPAPNIAVTAGTLYVAGTLVDAGAFSVASGGTLELFGTALLSGTPQFSGGSEIIAGGYVLAAANVAGSGLKSLTIATNGTVNHTTVATGGTETITQFGTQLESGKLTLSAGGTLVDSGSLTVLAGGSLVDSGVLTISSTGSLTDSGVLSIKAGVSVANNGWLGIAAGGSLANLGKITATSATSKAVRLLAGGNVTNGASTATTASITGGYAGVYSAGGGTLTNFGTISASSASGRGVWNQSGSIAIDNRGLISGAGSAVRLNAGSLSNAGSITSTGVTAVYAQTSGVNVTNLGTITAPGTAAYALKLSAGGSVTNGSATATAATISAGNVAVFAGGSAALTNYGTISGSGTSGIGISMPNGTVTLSNAGLISGGGSAIRMTTGSLANTGSITSSGQSAIYGINPGVTVTNSGTITATNTLADAVKLTGGSIINGSAGNTAATMIGGHSGAYSRGSSTVTNYGTIVGGLSPTAVTEGFAAVWCVTDVGDTATVYNAGLIYGTGSGVQFASGTGTLTNMGTIISTGTEGVPAAGVYLANGNVTVQNFGSIGAEVAGVSGIFVAFGTATINNSGTISSDNISVRFCGTAAGTLTNQGLITSSDAYLGGMGVYVANLGISVTNLGTISAPGSAADGIKLAGQDNVTNGSATNAAATIIGGDAGIWLAGSGTVTNFGTITGGGSGGVWLTGGPATVTNSGLISSTSNGVRFSSGSGSLNNSGIINSSGVFGVYASTPNVALTNTGSITSTLIKGAGVKLLGLDSLTNGSATNTTAAITGVYAGVQFSGNATVSNFGSITGATGVIWTGASGNGGTLIDSGRIASSSGAAGTAVQMFTGASRLVVNPGAVFVGKIIGSSGSVLELAPGSGAASIGAISGFGTLAVDSTASWTLQGSDSVVNVSNSGTLAVGAGATLKVSGSVDPASTGTFVLNAGAVLNLAANTGSADRIQFLGSAELDIRTAAQFGSGAGTPAYTGPLIAGFDASDTISLADITANGATLTYTAATGLLQVVSGGSTASLLFDTSSLGSGSFHGARDNLGHLLLTHS